MAPKYAKGVGRYKGEHLWNRHTYHWGRTIAKLGCELWRWKLGGERHPCETYLPIEECVYLWPHFGWRGCASVVVELGLEWCYYKWRAGMSCSTLSQMWASWYLCRFLFKGGSLTLMNIASLMVLGKPCDSLSTMEKMSNVMLCPVVLEVIKEQRGGPEMFFVPFTKMSACFPYVFHVTTRLITSVPVNDLPFLDDAVFTLWCYQEFLHCVGTFEANLESCFAAYVSETVTEAFGIWDHYKDIVVSYVSLWYCTIVFG